MKREEKSREKIDKHPRLQLWRPSYRTKVFPNGPLPFPFLESIPFIAFQRCPVVNQSARGKILVRVHELVYPLTRLKFISWFVDAPSGDVGGWMVSTVKQVAIATRASFTSALNPPTNPNLQPPRVFYPCIPQFLENRFRKHRLVPDLADLFLLQLEKFRWMENTHGLISNQCRLIAIYKLFISSDVWLRVNRMDEDFIARLIGIWMAEWVKMVDRFLRVV